MPTFRYSAYRSAGGEVSGTIEAENIRDARERLNRDSLFPKEITLATVPIRGAAGFTRHNVTLPQLALLTRRLATLLGSAVPVFEAVNTLYEQEDTGPLKAVLARLKDRLAEGASLARALADEPRVFNDSYVSMVAAGEASGALDIVLERLADFLEEQEALRSRVITALAYPALMVIVGTGVMLFLLAFVIPKIIVIFEESKATLPLITRLLIMVSHAVRAGWWTLPLLAVLAWYGHHRYGNHERVRHWRDRLMLRLPLAGSLLKKLILARFSKVLGLLLMSGVPVIKALEITSAVVVNREFQAFLATAREEVVQGQPLSTVLRRNPLFPPLLVHMIAVGEKGGTLEAMLIKAGAAFEKEFNATMARAMGLLEPLLVLAMGVAVGIVVLAVLLPIFQLNQLVK